MTKNIKNIRVRSICATLFISLFLSLIIGCSQQADSNPQDMVADSNNNLVNLLDKAGEAFFGFLDFVTGSMRFTVTKDTSKSEVGKHFADLAKGLEKALAELEKVAEKAVTEADKDGLLTKAVKEAKDILNILKGHLDSLKDIGDSGTVGEVKSDNKQGVAADMGTLKKVYQALKGIVTTAKNEGVSELKESNLTLEPASIRRGYSKRWS
ncbi:variable large family protein (plasmid) [Borrelia coriaceae]|uniref:variable large family protein n=1 Tax=Borrelia coriaceae TaxID=144 RepID=UPI0004B2F214|nr:variable large family protein [Borrelia coriaceae]UPA17326.1 variable large family protein [Borrelia coriaceae]